MDVRACASCQLEPPSACMHRSHLTMRQGGSIITSRLAATCSGSGISKWRSHCWCVVSLCLGAELLLQPAPCWITWHQGHALRNNLAPDWRLALPAGIVIGCVAFVVFKTWCEYDITATPQPLLHLLLLRPSSAWRHRTTRVESPGAMPLAHLARQGAGDEGRLRLNDTLSCAAGMWVVIRWWYRTQYAPAKHCQNGSSSAGSETKLTTWLRSKGRGSASTNSSGEIVQRARCT